MPLSDSANTIQQMLEKHFKPVRNRGPLQECVERWRAGERLSCMEARSAFEELFEVNISEFQIGEFLFFADPDKLSVDELTGFAQALRGRAPRPEFNTAHLDINLLGDTCGTGGDTLSTPNISTTIVFILAADGLPIAKHGNRAFTSRCGSADVLERLGVNINLTSDKVRDCIEKAGLGFMFAPVFHAATRRVAGVRKILANEMLDSGGGKRKTVFNLLGPLSNPAGVNWQLLGVYNPSLLEKMAQALNNLKVDRAIVVHGRSANTDEQKGLDEISIIGPTHFAQLHDGKVTTGQLMPEDFGLDSARPEDIAGGDSDHNAELLKGILKGKIYGAQRDMVLANAAAARSIGRALPIPASLKESVKICGQLIDGGAAYEKLQLLIRTTKELSQD